MANEITITVALAAAKGGATVDSGSLVIQQTMSGADMATFTQSVGTSAEALNVPSDISFPAYIAIANLDQTNYVQVYQDSGAANQIAKLNPGTGGEPGVACIIPLIAAVPYLKANSAACQIVCTAVEA